MVIPSENPSTSADKIGSFFIQLVFVRHNHKATKSRYFAESSKHRKKDEHCYHWQIIIFSDN
jgi:hypothetical protein